MKFEKSALAKIIAAVSVTAMLSACGVSLSPEETEELINEMPQVENPVVDPVVEEPVVEEPVVEDPVVADPVVDDPVVVVPIVDESEPEVPVVEEPNHEIPMVEDPIDAAIRTGNPALLPADRRLVEQRILDEISLDNTNQSEFFDRIYGDSAVKYSPSRWTSLIFTEGLANSYPLAMGNNGKSLAAANEINGQRNAAFGSNILRELHEGNLLDYQQAMKNLIAWLVDKETSELTQAQTVRFTLVDNTTFDRSKNWLLEQFPNWTVEQCSDANSFASCVSEDADLIITGTRLGDLSEEQVVGAFNAIQLDKTPQIYVHLHSWNTSSLNGIVMPYLGFSMPSPGNPGNYFSEDTAVWDQYQDMLNAYSKTASIETLVQRSKDNSFQISLADCSNAACAEDPDMAREFTQGANAIKAMVNGFDKTGRDIFQEEGLVLEKLMILLGDHYRQSIRYPMSKSSTNVNEFLRAYYADFSVYNYREHNPVQADLGNFSRTDFSHITPVSRTLDYVSKPNFRSAGVYALPGQTIRVSRLDDNEVATKVFVNSLRSASTKEFDNDKYHRPKYLESARIEVKPGETIYLTTPYGGPVQVEYSAKDIEVSLRFENVGEHPYWNGSEDDERFNAAIEKGDYDWAELVTPGFEVHSTLEKIRQTVENWNTGSAVAAATMQYVSNYPHVLAGFQGPGIDIEPEVHDFALAKGWTVPTIDIVKHMNADQATCGYGCSGNPYDAFWAFDPTGHGDLHELGHGLENGRFKFDGQQGHTHTNFYSYYSKSKAMLETGENPECQSRDFGTLLGMLQQSEMEADAFAYMQSQEVLKSNVGHSITMMIELAAVAQNQGDLANGWHIFPRMHLLDREYKSARANEDAWLTRRDSLGFSLFSKSEADGISRNDWLLIALSLVTQMDYSDYFEMWGQGVSDKARNQVAAMNYETVVTRTFYIPDTNTGYCPSLDMPAVRIQ